MTHHVTIPRIGAAEAWRKAARGYLFAGIPPEQITWGGIDSPPGLFDEPGTVPIPGTVTVPRDFIALANSVVWHADPSRFARLYGLLWRLRDNPGLMSDRGDRDLARLRQMEKNVHRCQHKMKAFVRFREVGDATAARRSFAAWFEPTHHTVEPTVQFFRRRFADMDWRILTPDVSAIFENGSVRLVEDKFDPQLPDDASEQLWITYFRNIFNPARLKVQAMQSEMPKKYWKNLPETAAIPELISTAPARARAMAAAAPTLPSRRAQRIQARVSSLASAWDGPAASLPAAIHACARCPLHLNATQAVPGEGPTNARLMIVGEQPGDQEDLQGRPFVGPAGQLFDEIAHSVGLDRREAFVTNAVKHFKFEPRGKRRLHKRASTSEISHCRWWLDAELASVKPRLIVAMGATAVEALTGSGTGILTRRGKIERTPAGQDVLITVHPAYLLRLPDADRRAEEIEKFRADLKIASDTTAIRA
ncbi:MAG: UdgX family uracil-DNA binding protein [Anderseniella sp.]|nr:UdgX family uracil-DNA binding protein [Anderseniella sp.]